MGPWLPEPEAECVAFSHRPGQRRRRHFVMGMHATLSVTLFTMLKAACTLYIIEIIILSPTPSCLLASVGAPFRCTNFLRMELRALVALAKWVSQMHLTAERTLSYALLAVCVSSTTQTPGGLPPPTMTVVAAGHSMGLGLHAPACHQALLNNHWYMTGT